MVGRKRSRPNSVIGHRQNAAGNEALKERGDAVGRDIVVATGCGHRGLDLADGVDVVTEPIEVEAQRRDKVQLVRV
ncbi:MAG: hypothetical protein AB7Q92_33735 [Acidimicrobiia bacterium]